MEEAAAPVLLVVNKYTAAFNNAAPGSEHLWELATTGKNVNDAGQPSQTQVYPLHCVMPAPSLLQISFFEKGLVLEIKDSLQKRMLPIAQGNGFSDVKVLQK